MTSPSDSRSSKELVDQLRYVSQSANGYTELADACIAEIQRLTGMSAELLSICIQMREWLKPELVKEPDRTFFWKLNERIDRFTKGAGATAEPPAEPFAYNLRRKSDGLDFGLFHAAEAADESRDEYEFIPLYRHAPPPASEHPDTALLNAFPGVRRELQHALRNRNALTKEVR